MNIHQPHDCYKKRELNRHTRAGDGTLAFIWHYDPTLDPRSPRLATVIPYYVEQKLRNSIAPRA